MRSFKLCPEHRGLRTMSLALRFSEETASDSTQTFTTTDLRSSAMIGVPPDLVLAHVMAHEIGHVLLGLNSHSSMGIMRGYWQAEEVSALERGRLLFSSQQSRAMRERLQAISARTMASAAESSGIAGRPDTR